MKNAIEIKSLTKVYNNGVKAVNDISLNIPEKSFYAILGPNGAGKTTTIGILTGLINPTSGNATVFNYDVIKEYRLSRKQIGLAPQELNFDVFFTIEELLFLQAGYYGLSRKESYDRIYSLLEQFELMDKKNNTARELSGGMKRRVQIVKSLVHDPPILILDEPTAGVDIELRYKLWDVLKKLNKDKTILLTTHYIEEAEKLCDNIAIIDGGKIILNDTADKIMKDEGKYQISVDVDNWDNSIEFKDLNYSIDNDSLIFNVSNTEKYIQKIIQHISNHNKTIKDINIRKSSLEDIFIKLTGKKIDE